ncbi:Alpha/Beta hydrolase protein [Cercophora newfieldiana]|uniref:Carboxypeptidase n=1 Tax=Cercophora newfieldiana TaxID=92897 RepID=A0AA40CUT8_9PEZI|nr:Alpha/Beta hydrolase protein [Cercophora newfieldiana]
MRLVTAITSALLISVSAAASGFDVERARGRLRELTSKQRTKPNFESNEKATKGSASGPQFLNANTTKFAVNGSGIPEVDFDIGESYAGSLPISTNPDEQGNLFFWFFPSKNPAASKEIVIWLNGGPGCSSLAGLLQENGPFTWQYGTYKPVENPWGWNTLTNMIWVEQPVGTGFSTGPITANNEEDVAAQFNGFWRSFVDTFGLHDYKVYVTGESYAGRYCPYISSAMLDANDTTYFDLAGMMIYDPSINNMGVQSVIPLVQFVDYWGGLFPFNDTFRANLHAHDKSCGFSAYVEEYLVYPPKGPQPSEDNLPGAFDADCYDIFTDVIEATISLNPCFSFYHVATTCPLAWDVLGFPGSTLFTPEGAEVYFDRTDVKNAIHAPKDIHWSQCAERYVFANMDSSEDSISAVLPHVIEATQNVIISHGALDMILLANGTLLGIQNMTWGGKLGFRNRPTQPFYVPASNIWTSPMSLAAEGVFGTVISERGLTYVGVSLAGHMVPQFAPSAAYRQLEFLLGRVDCLNCTVPFTTDRPVSPQSKQPMGNGTAPQGWSGKGADYLRRIRGRGGIGA